MQKKTPMCLSHHLPRWFSSYLSFASDIFLSLIALKICFLYYRNILYFSFYNSEFSLRMLIWLFLLFKIRSYICCFSLLIWSCVPDFIDSLFRLIKSPSSINFFCISYIF